MFTIKRPLWQHQQWLVNKTIQRGGKQLWNAGVGVGKTLASLEYARRIEARRILVITLKTARFSVWVREIETSTAGLEWFVPDSGTRARKSADTLDFLHWRDSSIPAAIITNYETAVALPLQDMGFDLVILDESHRVKTYSSQVSNVLAEKLRYVPHKILMSGTPYEERPLDVFGQIRILTPVPPVRRGGKAYWQSSVLGSYTAFFKEYAIAKQLGVVQIAVGYKNLDKLAQLAAPYVLTVDRNKVLDLPAEQHIDLFVDLPAELQMRYDKLKRDFITEIDGHTVVADGVLSQMLRLAQITNGHYRDETGEIRRIDIEKNAKLTQLMELVESIGTEPFVIFTVFKEDVELISAGLDKLGVTHSRLTGDQNQFEEWYAGKTQTLIANLAAGSAGLNMTRARIAIFYSLGNTRKDYVQALGRISRPGADVSKNVVYYYILASKTIDKMLLNALQLKGDLLANFRKELNSVR